jgi:hypothetical protein
MRIIVKKRYLTEFLSEKDKFVRLRGNRRKEFCIFMAEI